MKQEEIEFTPVQVCFFTPRIKKRVWSTDWLAGWLIRGRVMEKKLVKTILTKNHLFVSACRPKVYSADTIPWRIWKKYEKRKMPKCLRRVKKTAIKRMKDVKLHLVRQQFTHKCYLTAIQSGKPRFVQFFSINSRCHDVSTYKKGKLGLSGKWRFFIYYKK